MSRRKMEENNSWRFRLAFLKKYKKDNKTINFLKVI